MNKERLDFLATIAKNCGSVTLPCEDFIQLVGKIDQLERERDRAINELRSIGDNCFCCRWWTDEPPEGGWLHNHCSCPDTCCADDNPDRWEWRGVTNEVN